MIVCFVIKKITGRDDHVDDDYVINRAEEVLSTIDKKNSFVEISFSVEVLLVFPLIIRRSY
ncbi:hypothetical protein [Caloramator sp. Dgby_cultured_2]|uniref:hypothetical protein n=1 Tax=Caloramator sp. Dgby_cultured_2 TaxID=3029174 RepID=UPI00315977B5